MAKKKETPVASGQIVARNRRAKHDYHLELTVEAGIMLQGTEVKSLRDGKVNLEQAYARIEGDEVWLIGANFPEYGAGSWTNHQPQAKRKLLLHRREIKKLSVLLTGTGRTLIPLDIHFGERGHAKVLIAVAVGKKLYDKRQTSREKDAQREMDRATMRDHRG
jgi:SsrA-binding protein